MTVCPECVLKIDLVAAQAPFPDPRDPKAWNLHPMWPCALGSDTNISYEQQAQSLKKDLLELEISIRKVTHAWRVAGAQAMDSAGVDDAVSQQLSFDL